MNAVLAPTRPIFTTSWALSRLPGPTDQERVEQTALAHMTESYRAWLSSRRHPEDRPRWARMIDAALEHAMDTHDAMGWTKRRIDATADWLTRAIVEIEEGERK